MSELFTSSASGTLCEVFCVGHFVAQKETQIPQAIGGDKADDEGGNAVDDGSKAGKGGEGQQ
jgi:hypothetical protein